MKNLYHASSSSKTISDIAILSVPICTVWNLQMSVRYKIGISAVFRTGGLYVESPNLREQFVLMGQRACIANILRLLYCVSLIKTDDYTHTKLETAMWTEYRPSQIDLLELTSKKA